MVNITELKAQMVRKQYTQEKLAGAMGISNRTLYNKFKSGVFGSDEIEKMISILDIKEPMDIFFAKEVS